MQTIINVPVINNSKNPLPKYETTEAAGLRQNDLAPERKST